MKLEQISEAITYAFALEATIDRIYHQHFQDIKKKNQKEEELSVQYLMSENGKSVLQLLGYYLSLKMGNQLFVEMGKEQQKVFVGFEDFKKYCERVWPDMGKYQLALPMIFRILKKGNAISLIRMDRFVEICRKEMNYFMVQLKQNYPYDALTQFTEKLSNECEKEDLLGSGYVQKYIIEDVFKNKFKNSIPEIPKQLYNENNANEVNYVMLLGHKYLKTGQSIDLFLKSKLIEKIVRFLKAIPNMKKGVKKAVKKKTIKRSKTQTAKASKVKEKEKVLAEFIQTNKAKKHQSSSQFISKSIIQDLIRVSVDVSVAEGKNKDEEQKITKSVYVVQPQFPEMQYAIPGIAIPSLKFVQRNGLGLFVSESKGYMVDCVKATKKNEFQLNLSHIFKLSPIISYEVWQNVLYLLKQNGLLYSWAISDEVFCHQIQTSFKKLSCPPQGSNPQYLLVKDGVVAVNCTHGKYNRMELYSLSLEYVGVVELSPTEFGIDYKLCEQAKYLYESKLKNISLDRVIKNFQQYKTLMANYHDTQYLLLGKMLCAAFQEKGFSIKKLTEFVEWIVSFKEDVYIVLPTAISQKLKSNTEDQQVLSYLQMLRYIASNQQQEVANWKKKVKIQYKKNRKMCLLTLFQDNSLNLVKQPFLTKQQFIEWVSPACLMNTELKELMQQLQYRPDGKVDMSQLYYSEHYRRLLDVRFNQHNPNNYKFQELPPLCIQNFVHIPTLQLIVLSVTFPLKPNFYVCNMLTGNIIQEVDLSHQTNLPPKLRICNKNGYIFVIAKQSLSLWSPLSLHNTEKANPVKTWNNLQSSEIIDVCIIYEQATVMTLTKDCIKIWDFNQMIKKKDFVSVFQVKPGYRAIESQFNNALKNFKKKILIRETATTLFYFVSPNDVIVGGAISLSQAGKWYINSFAINKFNVSIKMSKDHYQIPTKLLQELQAIAAKRKSLPPIVKNEAMSECQRRMFRRIVEGLQYKIHESRELQLNSTFKPELQQKIMNLANSVSHIYSRGMFKQNNEQKRYHNIFNLVTQQNFDKLQEFIQPKFLQLYKTQTGEIKIDLVAIMQDFLSSKEKKAINRVFYVLSLVEKYTRVMVMRGVKLGKLISSDRLKLDEALILSILPEQLLLDSRIVTKSVKLLNSLINPLRTAIKIIESYLPTRYRFLVPRYIKQIVRQKNSNEQNEYISNRYQINVTPSQVAQRVMESAKSKSIQQFIEDCSILPQIQQTIISTFPLALNCNFSLIESLLCLKLINEDSAFYYCLKESSSPQERLSAKIKYEAKDYAFLDQIAQQILNKIQSEHLKLPYPRLSFQYFKKELYNGSQREEFFFTILQGDKQSQQVSTALMDLILDMSLKKVSVGYNVGQWQQMMGQHAQLLKPYLNEIMSKLSTHERLISVLELKTALMSFIKKEEVYEDVAKRAAFASTTSKNKQQLMKECQGQLLYVEGMWVNINYLYRFVSDYNPFLQELNFSTEFQKQSAVKIPGYCLMTKLVGSLDYVPLQKFREMLAYNLFPLSLSEVENRIRKYFSGQNKNAKNKVSIFEIADLLPKNLGVIGRILIYRYYRVDFRHRMTVINKQVSSNQISQLLNSRVLTIYLFGENSFFDVGEVAQKFKTQLLDIAANEMSEYLITEIPKEILQLIEDQQTRSTSLPAAYLSQLIQKAQNEHSIILCLLKFIASESETAQLINLGPLISRIKQKQQQCKLTSKYEEYRQKLANTVKNKNVIQTFLELAQPQSLPFVSQIPTVSYFVTLQHMRQLLQYECQWLINYKPYATALQFIDHVRREQRQEQECKNAMQLFTQTCICRVGIDQIFEIVGQNPSFGEFWSKLKFSFKFVSKMQVRQVLYIYRAIVRGSSNKICDADGLQLICQKYIPVHKKAEWICAIYDRELVQGLQLQADVLLDWQVKLQKAKILYKRLGKESQGQLPKILLKESLHYHRYLIYKYLNNDQAKVKQIREYLRQKKMDEAKAMFQIYGVSKQIHQKQLTRYFNELYGEEENRKRMTSDEPSLQQLKMVIKQIKACESYLNDPIHQNAIARIANSGLVYKEPECLQKIRESKTYQSFINGNGSGIGAFYCTYHSLLQFCELELAVRFSTEESKQSALLKVRDFLIRRDFTPSMLYQLLDLTTYDNLRKYLPELALIGSEREEEVKDIFLTFEQMLKPGLNDNSLKYPLSFAQFEKFISNQSSKVNRGRKQYESLYLQLDVCGNGYVNLNDLSQFRGKCPNFFSPYVYIPKFIEYTLSQDKSKNANSFPSNYIGPTLNPPNDKDLAMRIKKKLLRYELPTSKSQKSKLIKTDVCLAILGEFGVGYSQYQEFVKQKFQKLSNAQIDLGGIITWLKVDVADIDTQIIEPQAANTQQRKVQAFIDQLDKCGGLHAWIAQFSQFEEMEPQKFFSSLLQVTDEDEGKKIKEVLASTMHKSEKCSYLFKIAQRTIQRYSKKWDTLNNPYYQQVKSMAQISYNLVWKFYKDHQGMSIHKIYDNICKGGEFTSITLWRYIQNNGITGFSQSDISEMFSAIDFHSNGKIKYLQFCQFWTACQHIFKNQNFNRQVTKIDEINTELSIAFLNLFLSQQHNCRDEVISEDQIIKLVNLPNVEKVEYIVRSIDYIENRQCPRSGALNTQMQLNKSKLKIMAAKTRQKVVKSGSTLREDLYLWGTFPDLSPYCKATYNAQELSKIIMAKYPKFCQQILQHFHDLCLLNPISLQQKYKPILNKESQSQNFITNKQNYISQIERLITKIQESYRKHPFRVKSYEHKETGSSIAYSLLAELADSNMRQIEKEIKHMYDFVRKAQIPIIPLIYELQQESQYNFENALPSMKSVSQSELNKYPHQTIIEKRDHSLYSLEFTIYSRQSLSRGSQTKENCIMKRKIVWKDPDLAMKSESKVNLLFFSHLYNDPQISIVPINEEQSSRFKIEGACHFKSQYQSLTKMYAICQNHQEKQEQRKQLIDRVMSLLKAIVDKLIYCYFKYGVSGLLLLPDNLLVNTKQNNDIKFQHFLTAILLNTQAIKNKQKNVNYIDGIDAKYFINETKYFPPQAKFNIQTQAMDVFMVVHIVFELFKNALIPLGNRESLYTNPKASEEESLWQWSSTLHEIALEVLKNEDARPLLQKEKKLWILLYQCSSHDWFIRPRLYQVDQAIKNYFDFEHVSPLTNLMTTSTNTQKLLNALSNNQIQQSLEMLRQIKPSVWTLNQIQSYCQSIKKLEEVNLKLIQYFNSVLQSYLSSSLFENDPQRICVYLQIVVDFVLLIPVGKGGQCLLVNSTFKNILNSPNIQKYLSWCDENWKINEFEINKKIEKINMDEKLKVLHKNSSFYFDILSLAECRLALVEASKFGKAHETSKKVAISFIHSCIVSNNLNKIYAVYRSQVLQNIYCFGKDELQPTIISIFQIATACFNPTFAINRYRTVNEVYRVMMVISNSINLGSPKSTQSSRISMKKPLPTPRSSKSQKSSPSKQTFGNLKTQSIVSMMDFVNNYYAISGQQCKESVLQLICRQQLCTLPAFVYLFNQIEINKLDKIILNLSYDELCYKTMRSAVVGDVSSKLIQNKNETLLTQMNECITSHTSTISLNKLATTNVGHSNYAEMVQQYLKFYSWYIEENNRQERAGNSIPIIHQRNVYNHLLSFISNSQKVCETEIQFADSKQESLEIVKMIILFHRITFEIWTKPPCHPDFTAATLRFLMNSIEQVSNNSNIYAKNKLDAEVSSNILYTFLRFWNVKDSASHDLAKIAIRNGYIQFYCRTVRKQHQLMKKWIDKNVQNIHLSDSYQFEAQFRLLNFYSLLQNMEYVTDITQILMSGKFISYVVQTMLQSPLALDLRFFKSNDQAVPFRYCRPLRAEAITMIGFALSTLGSPLSDSVANLLVPCLGNQLKNIQNNPLQSDEDKMDWVESLWLLSNITNTNNERLKYEFVNIRLHQVISSNMEKYPFIEKFFPEMTKTIKTSALFAISTAKSQIQ